MVAARRKARMSEEQWMWERAVWHFATQPRTQKLITLVRELRNKGICRPASEVWELWDNFELLQFFVVRLVRRARIRRGAPPVG